MRRQVSRVTVRCFDAHLYASQQLIACEFEMFRGFCCRTDAGEKWKSGFLHMLRVEPRADSDRVVPHTSCLETVDDIAPHHHYFLLIRYCIVLLHYHIRPGFEIYLPL
jgi:hypothetical protein